MNRYSRMVGEIVKTSFKKSFDFSLRSLQKFYRTWSVLFLLSMSVEEAFYWKERGDDFAKQGAYQEAIQCYKKATDLNPDSISAWNNMGYSLWKLGWNDEARAIKIKIKELKEKEKILKECQDNENFQADKLSNNSDSSVDTTLNKSIQLRPDVEVIQKVPDIKTIEKNLNAYGIMRDVLRKRFGKEPSDGDTQWGILNKEKIESIKFGNWEKYCEIEDKMGDILRKEGKNETALEHYFVCLYLCINGPGDQQETGPGFDPKKGYANSQVFQKVLQLKEILGYSDDQIKKKFLVSIDRHWSLPLRISPQISWDRIITTFPRQKIRLNLEEISKYSKAHLLLLSKFLYPRERDYFLKFDTWTEVLKEPPSKTIENYLKEKLLREASLPEKMAGKFTIAELKPLLKERNLSVTGKKAILIERLVQNDQKGMESLVAEIDVLICTDEGRTIAEDYLTKEREIRSNVEEEVFSQLVNGNFLKASEIVANFEAKQVFPRGIGIDWRYYDSKRDVNILKGIFTKTPKILNNYSREQVDILRPAAAMIHLWGTNDVRKWIPDEFPIFHQFDVNSAARMILFHVTFLSTIQEYKKSGIKKVEILTAQDSCEYCKDLKDKTFNINSIPEIPHPKCSHKYGCRCSVVPIIR